MQNCNIYQCKYCGKLTNNASNICNHCIGNMKRLKLPDELKEYVLADKPIPFDIYNKYDIHSLSKHKVSFICSCCHQESVVSIRKLSMRKYGCNEQICNMCINKYSANTPEKKHINSMAQKLAQNKPETKEKQRKRALDNMKNDKDFFIKRTHGRRYFNGYYNGISFDSSYELSYLVYHKNDIIYRSDDKIPYYFNGKLHIYQPDFILEMNDKKYLVEIKGYIDARTLLKKDAAIKYCNGKYDDYLFLDRDALQALPNFIFYTKNKLPNDNLLRRR